LAAVEVLERAAAVVLHVVGILAVAGFWRADGVIAAVFAVVRQNLFVHPAVGEPPYDGVLVIQPFGHLDQLLGDGLAGLLVVCGDGADCFGL
jgi:hypothetical protein